VRYVIYINIYIYIYDISRLRFNLGKPLEQLFEALRCRFEDRGFDSRWNRCEFTSI
jgi:hypothetical protein